MDKYEKVAAGWDRTSSNSGMTFTPTGYTAYCPKPGYFNSSVGVFPMRKGKKYLVTFLVRKRSLKGLFYIGVTRRQNLELVSFASSQLGWAYYPSWSGCKVHNGILNSYGEPLSHSGQITMEVNLVEGSLSFTLNGRALGQAFVLPVDQPLYPAFATCDAHITCSFYVNYWTERRVFLFVSKNSRKIKKIPLALIREIAILIA